jgi:predicted small secreted protein
MLQRTVRLATRLLPLLCLALAACGSGSGSGTGISASIECPSSPTL